MDKNGIEQELRAIAAYLSELAAQPRFRIESSPVAVSILRDSLEDLQSIHERVRIDVMKLDDPVAPLVAAHLSDVLSVLTELLFELDQITAASPDSTKTVGRLAEQLRVIADDLRQVRSDSHSGGDRPVPSRSELDTRTNQQAPKDAPHPKLQADNTKGANPADHSDVRPSQTRIVPFVEKKQPILMRRLEHLEEEFEACAIQYDMVRDSSDQVRIKRKMDMLEQLIAATEQELEELAHP